MTHKEEPAKMEDKKEYAEPFSKLNLKVAKILTVSDHYKADKLLIINIDLGTEKRQLVAGLRPYYPDPQVLVGKHIICVTNLEHANLRGEMSQGMMLAAETADSHTVEALEAPDSSPGEQVFVEGITPGNETIKFDDFLKVSIYVENHKVMNKGKQLQTKKEHIKTKIVENGKVR
jgi:methionine--tRNA ligase beta chain